MKVILRTFKRLFPDLVMSMQLSWIYLNNFK
jgi:hypothetical protein